MDTARFELLSALEGVAGDIREEGTALTVEDFVDWPDTAAYTGTWLTFPLALCTYPDTLVVDLTANRARCPRTCHVLDQHPRIIAAGFSRMEPGCHILPHVDFKEPDVLRAHLGLKTDQHAVMRVAADIHHWQDGKTMLFDALIDHETVNLGNQDRLVLMFDFKLTAEEHAYAKQFNSLVDARYFVPASVKIPFTEVCGPAAVRLVPRWFRWLGALRKTRGSE